MLGDTLAYVALATRDGEAAAGVFTRQFGLPRHDVDSSAGRVPVVAIGASALAFYPLGHPDIDGTDKPGVHHIALGVRHLDDGLAEFSTKANAVAGPATPGLAGRKRAALPPAATGHVRTFLTQALDLAPARSAAIERLDHLGIASADNAAATAAWTHRLGRPIESQQTDMEVMIPVESFTSDKYGVVYHTRAPVPVGGLRVTFIGVGDTDLEFLQNFDPGQRGVVDHGSAGTTRQDQGAIAKYVAARGPGLHHIAMKTPDINGLLAALDKAGVALIDKTGRPGSRAGLIGFMHPKTLGGVLAHFDERP